MGAEGYVTMQRVKEGEYLIADDREVPQFVVREPSVAFFLGGSSLPAMGWPGTGFALLSFDAGPPGLESICRSLAAQVVALRTGDAVVIVTQRAVEAWLNRPENGRSSEFWRQLTPGRWLVTRYETSGTDHDDEVHRYTPPDGVVMGPKIDWIAWT